MRRLRLANDIAALVLVLVGLAGFGVFLVAALFWSGWLLLVLLLPFAYLARRWLSGLSVRRLAAQIETYFSEVRGKLVPAIELAEYQAASKEGYSQELIDAAIADTEARIKGLPLSRVVKRRRVLWGGLILGAGLALLLSYQGLFPTRSRMGVVNAFAPGRLPVEFVVEPGDTSVLPGGETVLRCRIEPAGVFRRVVFERFGQRAERRWVALVKGNGQVSLVPKYDFRYRFRVLSRTSDDYEVRVIEPVRITRILFRYRYPEYSGLPDYQSSSTEIAALKGTRVELVGEASRSLAAGRIVFGDDTVRLIVGGDGTEFRGEFTLLEDREGRIELADERGTGYQPVEQLRLRPMPDEAPLVKVFLPGRNVDLPMSMRLVLGINSLDDFGLGGLYLHYSKDVESGMDIHPRPSVPIEGEGSEKEVVGFERKRLKLLAGKREDTTFYTWDLSDLGLLPGDEMSYYVSVSDNDAVSGPKSSRTELFRVRFPTMTEIYNASVKQTERTSEELGPMQQTQEKLGEQLERISQQLMQEGNLSWDERQALRQVLADQGQLAQQIQDLQKEVEGLLDELSSGIQLDQETMERLGQLQELLSRLLPQELQQSLARLAEELDRKSPDLRKALSEFKLNQDQLRQSIDQALEFLARVLEEQRLEALARKAEELAKTQEELVGKVGTENPELMSRFQQALGRAIDSLQKEMKELAETMSDSAVGDSLADLAEGMEQDSLGEMANSTAQAMKQGKNQQARTSGQKLGQKLKSLSQSLNSLSQGMKKKRSNEVARQLLLAAEELLAISRRQEELANDMNRLDEVSTMAGMQMGLSDGTRVVAESLAALGSRTMAVSSKLVEELGRSMKNMQDAAQSLVENRAGQARQQMLSARIGLDNTVSWILQALEKAQQGSGMSGGMEGLLSQLSQMTADQMQINAGMGGIPIPVPGGLTPAQLAALERIMAMQRGLRERLEQMLQQMGGQQPGLTSSLEGVLDEMKQVERDLAELNITRELLERQESILSHLLDAQRSVRQRGFKEERESETAKPFQTGPSPTLPEDSGERNRLLREELMRSLKEARFAEYERMIRAYFEELLNQP